MSALDHVPENANFLSPLGFKFLIKRMPYVRFFIQRVNIPGIALAPVDIQNPFTKIPYAGDHIEFNELTISFKVDESLQNYLEVHNWIRALGFASNHEEYAAIADLPSWTDSGLTSDISLLVLDSKKIPKYEVTFYSAHPIELSDLNFVTDDDDVTFIDAMASFRYTLYQISSLTS